MKPPDLAELLGLRGAAKALELASAVPARARMLGSRHGANRGRGLEFEEVRPYVPGDDSRSIDWRVTARRGRLHTKLFREERERPVWLLVDLQPGMYFGSRTQLKSSVAVRGAALLAWVAAANGDRIGAVVANGRETLCLRPRAREAGVLPILNALLDLQPRAPAAPLPETCAKALGLLAPLVHPGSLVLALSDFCATSSTSENLWSALVAHSECRWFWITDELERQGLPAGRFRAGLPGRLWPLDGAVIRSRWLAVWQEREARLNRMTARLRTELTPFSTSRSVEASLQPALQGAPAAA